MKSINEKVKIFAGGKCYIVWDLEFFDDMPKVVAEEIKRETEVARAIAADLRKALSFELSIRLARMR